MAPRQNVGRHSPLPKHCSQTQLKSWKHVLYFQGTQNACDSVESFFSYNKRLYFFCSAVIADLFRETNHDNSKNPDIPIFPIYTTALHCPLFLFPLFSFAKQSILGNLVSYSFIFCKTTKLSTIAAGSLLTFFIWLK